MTEEINAKIDPIDQSLYPHFTDLATVLATAKTFLPGMTENQLTRLFMIYHNTLLKEIAKKNSEDDYTYSLSYECTCGNAWEAPTYTTAEKRMCSTCNKMSWPKDYRLLR